MNELQLKIVEYINAKTNGKKIGRDREVFKKKGWSVVIDFSGSYPDSIVVSILKDDKYKWISWYVMKGIIRKSNIPELTEMTLLNLYAVEEDIKKYLDKKLLEVFEELKKDWEVKE